MANLVRPKVSDARPWIYAGLDLCFVILYIVLALVVIPGHSAMAKTMQWLLILAMSAAMVGSLLRRPVGWWVSVVACAVLLILELLLLLLLLLSASYLAGVYGSFGRGASALTLVVAALSIELVALLPALQMKYLLSRAGRRAYKGEG